MKVFYDHEVDALYLQLGEEQPDGVAEITEGVNVDVTSDGRVVGIEILEASKKIDLQTMFAYSLDVNPSQLFQKVA